VQTHGVAVFVLKVLKALTSRDRDHDSQWHSQSSRFRSSRVSGVVGTRGAVEGFVEAGLSDGF